jgi:glutathione peroxidase-family protein
MIKYCYTVDNLAKTVQIVLQSIEPSAFNFYTMLVNKSGNAINRYDGHGKLTQGKRKVEDKKRVILR